MSTLIVNLDDESLLALHARLDSDGPDDPAAVEAHHTVTTEMARRGIEHGHDGDAWSAAVILVDSVEVDGPDVIEAPEELQKTWNATLSDGGTVSVLLTVDGYVLKADPTVSDVHVDAVMGGGRRRKLAKTDWKVGDFASWQSSGGVARGKILRIVRDGKINVPDSSFTVTADEDDPAVLLEVWRRGPDGWAATDTKVGHKASTLTKLESLTKADGYAVPSGVQAAARQALKWIADGRAGDGFTSVGRARAQQLADGGSVSRETLVKMRAYFARHIVDKDAEGWGDRSNPTPGMVAWYAWGGDAGRAWANKVLADDPVEKREIPAAINDLHLNVLNRQHAIDEYLYGPMNPDQPGDYWERLGAVWGVSAEQAQTTRCDNCSAFNVTSEIRTAIADAIGEGGEGVVEAADLGYCELLQFKCAGSRSCEVWLTGGPLSDHPGTDIHDDEPQPVAKFTLPDGAVYEFVVPSEPVVKHPGHGSQKVHGHRHAGATDLPDDITSEIKRTNRGVIAEAYGPEFARGRQARRGRDERGEPKPFRVSSTGTGKNELGQAIARRDMAIESLRKLPKGDDILGSRQTLVASIAANQGFIDGVVGNRAQFARSHSVGETLAGYLYGGLSGATKAVEPVIKHPGHPDQKVHAGRSASLSPEVAASIIERTRVNGGLSVNMVDGSEPPKGYMVARGGTRGVKPAIVDAEDFYDPVKGPKVLGDFLVTNRDTLTRGDYLGVWHDKQSGKVFLDVSENVMDRETAVRRGKRRDQISIWDVVNAEEIDTGGTGQIAEKSTNPSGTTAEFRRDDGGRDSPVRANTVGEVSGQSVVNFEPVTKHPGHSDQKVHGRRGGGAEAGAQSGGEYKGYSLGEPDNPPGEADKRRPDSIAAAKAMRDKIGQVEPQITRDMIDVATAHGGKMEGLDFRLKSEKSLARKIDAERDDPKFDGDPVKTAEAMSDVARYTMTFKDSEYTAGAQGVIDDLTKQGYELRVKNYWQPGDPYQGINIAAVHPGTGVRVELQLHTPTSLDFKEPKLSADDPMRRQSTHALYETYRESRDMRTRVSTYRSMMRQAAQIPVPAGAAALLSIGIPSFQPLTDLGGSVVSLA